MAIADTITSMQTHTSNAYTMIGYGTDLTGINKNLENLYSTIFEAFLEALRTPDTLFTNLPKKSGTGAVISLNDTANAPMRIELGASELSQSGTPTPSSPQDIHTISGSNKVVVCGKNLAYTGWAENFVSRINDNTKAKLEVVDGRNCLWFTAGAGYGEYDSKYIFKTNWKPNTQYTISYYGYGTPGYLNACIEYTDGTFTGISGTPITNWTKVTLTSDKNKTIKDFRGYWAGGSSYIDINTFMVEEGTTATTYEPYVSQEADIDLSSKNLFNPYKVKAENNATLIITPTGFNITRTHGSGYGDEFIASYTIENLKANTIYTFNFDVETELNIGNGSIYVYSDNLFGTALTKSNYASSGNNHKWNITTSSNGKMVIGFYGTTSAQNKIIKLTNVQLEEGSTKTNYIEYYDYGFYGKIGNYEDKFIRSNDGTWQLEKNIGKTIIDSSNVDDLVQDFATSYGHNRIMITKSKLGWQTSWTQNICLMNKYKEINSTSSTATGTFTLNFNQTYIMVFNDNFTDLATAKTEMIGTEIYIPLATPTYTPITGTLAEQLENVYQKLLSYSGTTNISQINNDLSFNMSVLAIEEL